MALSAATAGGSQLWRCPRAAERADGQAACGMRGLFQWSRWEVWQPGCWAVGEVQSRLSGSRPRGKLWRPGVVTTRALKTLGLMETVGEAGRGPLSQVGAQTSASFTW